MAIVKRMVRLLALPAALTLLFLAAAACGDDGDSDTDNQDGQPSGSPSPIAGLSPAPSAAPDAPPLEQLAASAAAGVEGVVEYSYETENVGSHPNGVWTVYRQGANFREDWFTNENGFPASTIVIVTAPDAYVCTSAPGAVTCSRDTPEHAVSILPYFIPITEIPSAIATGIPNSVTTELPAETVAGVQASCYDLQVDGRIGVGAEGMEEIKICFSSEGMLLSLHRRVIFDNPAAPEALLTLTAQRVTEPKAEDFQPITPPLS